MMVLLRIADLVAMELGAFGFAPKGMAHFAWSKTATILQIHGIGPFSVEFVDPVYELTDKGVLVRTSPPLMETDGKAVVYIRAGIEPAAEYVEGCL
jgi:hypothetical protein